MISEEMKHVTRERLRSPRAAAIAGLVYSVLMAVVVITFRRFLPLELVGVSAEWLTESKDIVLFAISLVPIAGVAFLWFMGVVRDLLGFHEDQFLSTVTIGSGLLSLGMIFIWASVAGAIVFMYELDRDALLNGGIYLFARGLMVELGTIFAMTLSGVYVGSTGTIWMRTAVVPRWLGLLTWATAVVLWLNAFFGWWVQLVFPAWVFFISVYVLIENRSRQAEEEES